MDKPLLLNEYHRRYYDVDVECHLVATVTKRIYIDEMAKHIGTHWDAENLDKYHKIIAEEVGEDEFHNNNQKFAEIQAPEEVTDDDIFEVMQSTDMFTTGSDEGKERNGEEIWKCVYCKEHFTGYGNNPETVGKRLFSLDAKCCDACNTNEVIPARMKDIIMMNHLGV
tara:strand:- start:259 stop:762 length:504 start_codon:yes stop_codon:yes gene_type:complete